MFQADGYGLNLTRRDVLDMYLDEIEDHIEWKDAMMARIKNELGRARRRRR